MKQEVNSLNFLIPLMKFLQIWPDRANVPLIGLIKVMMGFLLSNEAMSIYVLKKF